MCVCVSACVWFLNSTVCAQTSRKLARLESKNLARFRVLAGDEVDQSGAMEQEMEADRPARRAFLGMTPRRVRMDVASINEPMTPKLAFKPEPEYATRRLGSGLYMDSPSSRTPRLVVNGNDAESILSPHGLWVCCFFILFLVP